MLDWRDIVTRPALIGLGALLAVVFPFANWVAGAPQAAPFRPPQEAEIPAGPVGEEVRKGLSLLSHTRDRLPAFVGNGLNCTSCHLNAGRTPYAGTWVGIWGVYPEFRTRNARLNTLEDRVNDCFERSMNGKALPADGPEMRAILAYFWWLSRGVPTGTSVEGRGFRPVKPPQPPDAARGRQVYALRCAACHAPDGQGQQGPNGAYLFPPLWGPKSFNIAAGMARRNTAAAFIKANMPLGQANTLSDQEAADVAAYVVSQPRPDFPGKERDWPNGGKPKDSPY